MLFEEVEGEFRDSLCCACCVLVLLVFESVRCVLCCFCLVVCCADEVERYVVGDCECFVWLECACCLGEYLIWID